MKALVIIYLTFMFISMYFMFFFFLVHIRNRTKLFEHPPKTKEKTISIIVPAYNEEECLEGTVRTVLDADYPIEKIFIVNDGSTDRTKEIAQKLAKEFPSKVILLDKPNSGKAPSINYALKHVKSELFAIVDADSYPDKDAISKMVGHFDDEKVGAVTSAILVKNRGKFIQNLQVMEYVIMAWTRKLLDFVGGVWATPGPLSIYRKSAVDKINGFDESNMTEDIEVAWHLVKEGYRVRMCLAAHTYTNVPVKIKGWLRQRIRWDIGGIQTIGKYKSSFLKNGMLGNFILPFFVMSMFIGLLGVGVFVTQGLRKIIGAFLLTGYSYMANTQVLSLQDVYFAPSVLNFIGGLLLVFGFIFTVLGLLCFQEGKFAREKFFTLLLYGTFYLTVYPIILVIAIYKMAIKDIKW